MICKLKFLIERFLVNAFVISCLPLCFCSFFKCSKNEDHSTNEPALTTDREGNSEARSIDSNRNLEHSDGHGQPQTTGFNNNLDTEHANAPTSQKDEPRKEQEKGYIAQKTNKAGNSIDEDTDDMPSLAESSVSESDLGADNEGISMVMDATSTHLDSDHASVMFPTDISDCATIEEIVGHEEE